MANKGTFTKILAAAGIIFVWLPVLAPVLFAIGGFVQERVFHFDFLIPGELFIVVFAGGLMLLWAAVRAKMFRGFIGWSLLAAVILLFGSQGIAVATGIASGEREAAGFWWILVMGMFILYDLAVVILGIGGIRLLRKLRNAS
ncbi:MAG TPA: hypothetical protein PLI60_05270 [Anaerolineaceae bacterium]|nr:hypothetical protein [Anaerolineaceae bacterium]HPC06112.1 hypothetical protein [Anaerolineaceae bacterium]HQN05297.1 hypothetical protein [Anaerolineaceae bacterium]HQP08244.1 hypothetical protein [Anaerolineaceae bacterium]